MGQASNRWLSQLDLRRRRERRRALNAYHGTARDFLHGAKYIGLRLQQSCGNLKRKNCVE
jgi:hypothetical protein